MAKLKTRTNQPVVGELADYIDLNGNTVEIGGNLDVDGTILVNGQEIALPGNVLKTPLVAPTEQELVGIDTANAQNRITIGDNLEVSNGKLKVVDKFEQKEVNYVKEFNLNQPGIEGVILENIYNRFQVINNVLYCILNFTINNTTNENKEVYYLSTNDISIVEISDKLIDIEGDAVSIGKTNETIIAIEELYYSSSIDAQVKNIDKIPFKLNNSVYPNGVYVKINDTTSGLFIIPANTKLYFTGRVILTLL